MSDIKHITQNATPPPTNRQVSSHSTKKNTPLLMVDYRYKRAFLWHKLFIKFMCMLLDSTPTDDKPSKCAGGALSRGPNRWKAAINLLLLLLLLLLTSCKKLKASVSFDITRSLKSSWGHLIGDCDSVYHQSTVDTRSQCRSFLRQFQTEFLKGVLNLGIQFISLTKVANYWRVD